MTMDFNEFSLDDLAGLVQEDQSSTVQTFEDLTQAPALSAQKRLWFLDQLHQPVTDADISSDQLSHNSLPHNSLPHNSLPMCVKIEGFLDTDRLSRAVSDVITRQKALRTVFKGQADDLMMCVIPASAPPIDIIHLDTDLSSEQFQQYADMLSQWQPDLENGPLFQLTLIQAGDDIAYLFAVFHHIIFDGWSIAVFFNDLSSAYQHLDPQNATAPVSQIEIGFDFLNYASEENKTPPSDNHLDYWHHKLVQAAPLNLRPDLATKAQDSSQAATASLSLSPDSLAASNKLAADESISQFVLLLSVWQILLARHADQTLFVTGVPVAGRDNMTELDPLIGMFVNNLPILADFQDNPTFRTYLARLKNTVFEAFAHQDVPFDQIVTHLAQERDPNRHPVYQVGFVLQNQQSGSLEFAENLTLSPCHLPAIATDLDLDLQIWPEQSGWRCDLIYAASLFSAERMQTLLQHFQTLLNLVTDNPDIPISDYCFLTAAEQKIHADLQQNDRKLTGSCAGRLAQSLTDHAGEVAIVDTSGTYQYADLSRRISEISDILTDQQISAGDVVGISMSPNIDQVASVIACLFRGALWVHLDSSYPETYLTHVLQDCQPKCLLTQDQTQKMTSAFKGICIDVSDRYRPPASHETDHSLTPFDQAYLIYTSGSTGAPKGVIGRAESILNRHDWLMDLMPIEKGQKFCQKTAAGFVDWIQETLSPLLAGASLYLADQQTRLNPQKLYHFLSYNQISRLTLVPSLLEILLDVWDQTQAFLPDLTLVISSGESLPVDLAARFLKAAPHCDLINIYGSSEVGADATWHHVTMADVAQDVIPIGRPISGCHVMLVDDWMQEVPLGCSGELLIGGTCLSDGYWQNPEATSERFFDHQLMSGLTIPVFATGDNAFLDSRGQLIYQQRKDWQVKIRGQRVDLEAVTAILSDIENVSWALAHYRQEHGQNEIIAFAITETHTDQQLKAYVAEKLPAYMCPAQIYIIAQPCYLPNGKIDRQGLLAQIQTQPNNIIDVQEELTQTENQLADIWYDLTHCQHIHKNSDFFAIGGHSLLTVKLSHLIEAKFNLSLPVSTLMAHTNLAALAKIIDIGDLEQDTQNCPNPDFHTAPANYQTQLTSTQNRLLALQNNQQNNAYHFPIQLRLKNCHPDQILAALNAVIDRHDVFDLAGSCRQIMSFSHQIVPKSDWEQQIQNHVDVPFQLPTGPVIHALLLETEDQADHYMLSVVFHHIITDAWSNAVFINDFAMALKQAAQKGQAQLVKPEMSWADYSYSLEQWLDDDLLQRHLDHWAQHIKTIPAPLEWPTAMLSQGLNQTARDYSISLSADQVTSLQQLAAKTQTTPYMISLAALSIAISKICDRQDFIIGSATANRPIPALEDMMGVFANTLPIYLSLHDALTASDYLQTTRDAVLNALSWPWSPLDNLVTHLRQKAKSTDIGAMTSPFQVFFNMLPPARTLAQHPHIIEICQKATLTCEFDLMLFLQPGATENDWVFNWRCQAAIMSQSVLESFATYYMSCLDCLLHQTDNRLPELPQNFATEVTGYSFDIGTLQNSPLIDDAIVYNHQHNQQILPALVIVPHPPFDPKTLAAALGQLTFPTGTAVSFCVSLPRTISGEIAQTKIAKLPFMDLADFIKMANHDIAGSDQKFRGMEAHWTAQPPAISHRWHHQLDAPVPHISGKDKIDLASEQHDKPAIIKKASLLSGPELVFPADFPQTLPEHYQRLAKGQNGLTFINDQGHVRKISFAELYDQALAYLHYLQTQDCTVGSPLLIMSQNAIDLFTALWACQLGSFVPCLLPQAKSLQSGSPDLTRLVEMAHQIGAHILLTSADIDLLNQSLSGKITCLPITPGFAQAEKGKITVAQPTDLAMLLFTSGSTSAPKAVMLTHTNLLSMAQAICQRQGFDDQDDILNWMPLEHIGAQGMLSAVGWVSGANQIHIESGHILTDPLLWLDYLHQFKIAYSWAPHFAFALIAEQHPDLRQKDWDFSAVKSILNGGEAVIESGVAKIIDIMAPFGFNPAALHPSWGMCETSSSFLLYDQLTTQELDPNNHNILPVGTPHPGAHIRLVNEKGHVVPVGQEGRLEVSGPQINIGYFNNPAATADSRCEDGWFKTGDRAILNDYGLTITGRDKETLILNGQNFSQQALESCLESLSDISTSYVAAVCLDNMAADGRDQLAIFYHSPQQGIIAHQKISNQMTSALAQQGVTADYYIPLQKADFPKTAIGKIQRTRLAKAFRARQFDTDIIQSDLYQANHRTLQIKAHQLRWGPASGQLTSGQLTSGQLTSGQPSEHRSSASLPDVHLISAETPAELCQKLSAYQKDKPVLIVTRAAHQIHAGDVLNPHQSLCFSLAQTFIREQGENCHAIKLVDLGTDDRLEPSLIDFILSQPPHQNCHVMRHSIAYVNLIYPQSGDACYYKDSLKSGGRYLITGGTGAIGSHIARWLIDHFKAEVTILGRQAPSPDTRLAHHPKLHFYSLDLTSDSQIDTALTDLSAGGLFDGIFHCAGLYHEDTCQDLDPKQLSQEMRIKLSCLHQLEQLCLPSPAAFIAGFSTALNLLKVNGATSYLASNYGLDQWADSKSDHSSEHPRRFALKWPAWTDQGQAVGMSKHHQQALAAQKAMGLSALTLQEALDQLAVTLQMDSGIYAFGLQTEAPLFAANIQYNQPNYYQFSAFQDQAETAKTATEISHWDSLATATLTVKTSKPDKVEQSLAAPHDTQQHHYQQIIQQIWSDILGRDIALNAASFFELGGNSIKLYQVHQKLTEATGLTFPQVHLFEHITIPDLAHYLMHLTQADQATASTVLTPKKATASTERRQSASRRDARKQARRRAQSD